jgi:hypothetical protein
MTSRGAAAASPCRVKSEMERDPDPAVSPRQYDTLQYRGKDFSCATGEHRVCRILGEESRSPSACLGRVDRIRVGLHVPRLPIKCSVVSTHQYTIDTFFQHSSESARPVKPARVQYRTVSRRPRYIASSNSAATCTVTVQYSTQQHPRRFRSTFPTDPSTFVTGSPPPPPPHLHHHRLREREPVRLHFDEPIAS